jgi:hypothetical protein
MSTSTKQRSSGGANHPRALTSKEKMMFNIQRSNLNSYFHAIGVTKPNLHDFVNFLRFDGSYSNVQYSTKYKQIQAALGNDGNVFRRIYAMLTNEKLRKKYGFTRKQIVQIIPIIDKLMAIRRREKYERKQLSRRSQKKASPLFKEKQEAYDYVIPSVVLPDTKVFEVQLYREYLKKVLQQKKEVLELERRQQVLMQAKVKNAVIASQLAKDLIAAQESLSKALQQQLNPANHANKNNKTSKKKTRGIPKFTSFFMAYNKKHRKVVCYNRSVTCVLYFARGIDRGIHSFLKWLVTNDFDYMMETPIFSYSTNRGDHYLSMYEQLFKQHQPTSQ